jgi:hypothetical protein
LNRENKLVKARKNDAGRFTIYLKKITRNRLTIENMMQQISLLLQSFKAFSFWNRYVKSTYIGMFGKIVEILDDNYALVNVPERLSYGKSPLTKVPIMQLEKIDDSPIFTLEDAHAKMRFIMFEGTK